MSGTGGFTHEIVTLDRLEAQFQRRGAWTVRQAKAGLGRSGGHVDLLAVFQHRRIVVEVELSARRIDRDIAKASAIGATELWIVVPNRPTADSVVRRLHRLGVRPQGSGIVVLTLGQALQRISHSFPIVFRGECEVENK